LAVLLAKSPVVDKFDLSSVREIFCSAAPLSRELSDQLTSRLKIPVTQAYGMTELSGGCVICKRYLDEPNPPFGSAGLLYPNLLCKIVDPKTGECLATDQPGELWIKGPTVMKGYLNQKEATAATIDKDGYLHTGDIGYVNNLGYYFIVDRLKELIKFKAYQVPPAELEAILLVHPKVADVAVVGTPDEAAGELPKAYIVARPGTPVSAKEIQDFVAERVANYKQLRGGVEFVEQIPKSHTGKIQRNVLRDQERQKAKAKL